MPGPNIGAPWMEVTLPSTSPVNNASVPLTSSSSSTSAYTAAELPPAPKAIPRFLAPQAKTAPKQTRAKSTPQAPCSHVVHPSTQGQPDYPPAVGQRSSQSNYLEGTAAPSAAIDVLSDCNARLPFHAFKSFIHRLSSSQCRCNLWVRIQRAHQLFPEQAVGRLTRQIANLGLRSAALGFSDYRAACEEQVLIVCLGTKQCPF